MVFILMSWSIIASTSVYYLLLIDNSIATPVDVSCPKGQFFEVRTRTCMSCPCSEDKRQAECHLFCSESSTSPTTPYIRSKHDRTEFRELCPLGSYEDEDMARCRSCDVICEDAESKGTEKECKRKCPEYDMTKDDAVIVIDNVLLPLTLVLFSLVMCCITGMLALRACIWWKKRERVTRIASTHQEKKPRYGEIDLQEVNVGNRIDQWLSLLRQQESDSCYSSKASLEEEPGAE